MCSKHSRKTESLIKAKQKEHSVNPRALSVSPVTMLQCGDALIDGSAHVVRPGPSPSRYQCVFTVDAAGNDIRAHQATLKAVLRDLRFCEVTNSGFPVS